MADPLISVILCVRDGENYIRDALDSVAAQECADMEVVIVDDGSTDRSVSLARAHPVAPQIVSQAPLGLAAALNRAMGLVRGRYIAFIDHDDVWPQRRLEKLAAPFALDADLDCVFGKMVNANALLLPIGPPTAARLLGAMLVKHAAARKIGAFRTDVAHAANVDWISRAAALGLKFFTLEEIVLMRRVHAENMGARDRGNARGDLLRVIRDHHERRKS
jgi:glycosyltransferase involved in cell wall biosynthesis